MNSITDIFLDEIDKMAALAQALVAGARVVGPTVGKIVANPTVRSTAANMALNTGTQVATNAASNIRKPTGVTQGPQNPSQAINKSYRIGP